MMLDLALAVFFLFGAVCFYFGLVSLAYYPLTLAYPFWARRLASRARATGYTPTVSVLIPAFNEEKTIAASLASVLACGYPRFEVIVIDDGSTDGTAAAVQPFLADPRLRCLRQPNAGKAAALNRGSAAATGEIILFTDADSVFEPDTLRAGVAYFVDPEVGAVSGNDTPLAPRGPLQKMLVVTSHIGTGFVRRALSMIGVLPIISGNLGLVRTELLRRVGGFREIWGEDLELTFRLHRHGAKVVYGAATRVLAECPHTLAGLWKQRVRWMRSYLKIVLLNRDMPGNPRYGAFGPFLAFNFFNMVAVPLLQAAALVLLPVAVLSGGFALERWEWIAYLGWMFLLGAAVVAVLLDRTPRDLLYLPYAALLIFFSYFYNAVVLYSIWAEARSEAEDWNKLERRDPGAPVRAVPARRAWLAAGALLLAGAVGAGYWLGVRQSAQGGTDAAALPLVPQRTTTAIAIHFDGWRDWHDAYRTLLATPQARYVNRVGVSAGRADWVHFRWPGHEKWWSPEQARSGGDMLEEAVGALRARGYRTTAIFDVFASRYLAEHPEAASVDVDGKRSKDVVCLIELVHGDFGRQLIEATEALAASTSADTIAITELFYDKHCFDGRSLAAFEKATGRSDWPRVSRGGIDWHDRVLGEWRSREVAGVVRQLSEAVHRHGKTFALDVKVSRGDLTRNSIEYSQDYALLAPWVDEFIVWDYFAIEGLPPENSARVAAYFDDEFGADRFSLSIGLWAGSDGTISPEIFARGLRAAREGGAERIWITPARQMTPAHWDVLENFARESAGETVRLSRR
jgi:cellulose synthase/poly-beta-1,6-N-acetylglucosamine synthase-like glycosyltransferase